MVRKLPGFSSLVCCISDCSPRLESSTFLPVPPSRVFAPWVFVTTTIDQTNERTSLVLINPDVSTCMTCAWLLPTQSSQFPPSFLLDKTIQLYTTSTDIDHRARPHEDRSSLIRATQLARLATTTLWCARWTLHTLPSSPHSATSINSGSSTSLNPSLKMLLPISSRALPLRNSLPPSYYPLVKPRYRTKAPMTI